MRPFLLCSFKYYAFSKLKVAPLRTKHPLNDIWGGLCPQYFLYKRCSSERLPGWSRQKLMRKTNMLGVTAERSWQARPPGSQTHPGLQHKHTDHSGFVLSCLVPEWSLGLGILAKMLMTSLILLIITGYSQMGGQMDTRPERFV